MAISAGGERRQLHQQPARRDGWTKKRRHGFIEELTATSDVKAACRKVGMNWTGVYSLRRRDEAFARLWDEALAIGYVRLEAELLARALGELGDPGNPAELTPSGDEAPRPTLDPQLGTRLLAQRHAVQRGRSATPNALRHGSAEATDAALARKLAALRRREDKR